VVYQELGWSLKGEQGVVMIVMNLSLRHKAGAIRKLNHGLKPGLTITQVRVALSLCFLFQSVTGHLETGQAVRHACAETLKQDATSVTDEAPR
jgi:hypothetical protein